MNTIGLSHPGDVRPDEHWVRLLRHPSSFSFHGPHARKSILQVMRLHFIGYHSVVMHTATFRQHLVHGMNMVGTGPVWAKYRQAIGDLPAAIDELCAEGVLYKFPRY